MRVVIDGHWLEAGPPSGRNVVDALVRAWRETYPEDDLSVTRHGPTPNSQLRVRQHLVSTLVEAARVAGACDLLITQNFTPPCTKARVTATFIHDVLFQSHPEYFTLRERAYLSLIPLLARRADVILTSSRAEAHRIGLMNPRLKDRVRPVGLSVPYGLIDGSRVPSHGAGKVPEFILAVGRLNKRKNLAVTTRALLDHGIIGSDRFLVIVGEPDGAPDEIASTRDLPFIKYTGKITDKDLVQLYRTCSAFVFMSRAEGYGLPAREASFFGSPIALSNIPAFREMPLRGAFYADPQSPEQIAKAVHAALRNGRVAPEPPSLALEEWGRVVTSIRRAAWEKM